MIFRDEGANTINSTYLRRPAAAVKAKYMRKGGRERERERGKGERERERGGRERENIVGDRYIYTYFLETSTWTPLNTFERGSARC